MLKYYRSPKVIKSVCLTSVNVSTIMILIFLITNCTQKRNVLENSTASIEEQLEFYLESEIENPGRFSNGSRVKKMKPNAKTFDEKFELGKQLLYAGLTDQSISVFSKLIKSEAFNRLNSNDQYDLKKNLAVAYLRYGEQVNCIQNHSSESCVFPIQGEGIYSFEDYTEKAINLYNELLEANPTDIKVRSLLNIAYMTLGQYPDSVPKHFLLDFENFGLTKDTKERQFVSVSSEVGINDWGVSGGAIIDDFDNDGFNDIITTTFSSSTPISYYKNVGDGTFKLATKEAGLSKQLGGLNAIHGDINNDGYLDLLVLRGGWLGRKGRIPNSILLNKGNGSFVDVTIESGLLSHWPTQTAVFTDLNVDGHLDIVIANEFGDKDKSWIRFYMNKGNMQFEDVTEDCGVFKKGKFKGLVSGDFNNDNLPDLYLSRYNGENVLLENIFDFQTNKIQFKEKKIESIKGPHKSFGCWVWDANNDGLEDIAVTYYSGKYLFSKGKNEKQQYSNDSTLALYINKGGYAFENTSASSQLTGIKLPMGLNYGDFNGDGFLDFYLGTGDPKYETLIPNQAFQYKDSIGFVDVTSSSGLGHLQKGHGIAFGDIDNDGDEDILANMGGAYSGDIFQNSLFENRLKDVSFLVLKLEGTQSNRNAIGARVRVEVKKGGKSLFLYRTVSSGGSFGGNSFILEMGMKGVDRIIGVDVNWPNGKQDWVSVGANIEININGNYLIIEGQEEKPLSYERKKIQLNQTHSNHVHPDLGIALPKMDSHHHH